MGKSGVFVVFIIVIVSSCVKKPADPVSIAINPWPGYEFLFLAEQKGFFEEFDANIRLVQFSSLSDGQRAYISGRVDGMASTVIEAVQSSVLSDRPLEIVLVPDYSNGGDVIVAHNAISDIAGLKGKTVGCEVTSLGIYILYKALIKNGLSLADVNIVNVNQLDGEKEILSGNIDAFVTYPPASISILKNSQFHTIFSSAEIPYQIIDTVSVSKEAIQKDPKLPQKLMKVWEKALDYTAKHPEESYEIMANREGISTEDFKAVLGDLKILSMDEQSRLFAEPDKLQDAAVDVCNTLVHVESLQYDCTKLPNIVYRGY